MDNQNFSLSSVPEEYRMSFYWNSAPIEASESFYWNSVPIEAVAPRVKDSGSKSFWKTYESPSTSLRFQPLPLRTGLPPLTVMAYVANAKNIPELTAFLTLYFSKNPILKPILRPSDKEYILYSVDAEDQIQATIRYRYIGVFEGEPIHLFDCFCNRNKKSGLATQLLTAIHLATEHAPYGIFLKEGQPLLNQEPLYSSSYVYRKVCMSNSTCHTLSSCQANGIYMAYRSIYRNVFWIGNSVSDTNMHWRLWKKGTLWALACFQDSYQELKGMKMGWMTAYLTNTDEGLEPLVNACPFPYVWMDRVWNKNIKSENSNDNNQWQEDGPFHWYLYRFMTSLRPAQVPYGCYGIIV